jgi:hypothetical protein
MFKLIGKTIRFAIFLLILAVIFHNWTAKTLLAVGLQAVLGAPCKVEEVKVDFVNTQILFQGIQIGNPFGFPSGELAVVPKIFVDLDPRPLLQGVIRFETIELDLKELRVVRNRDGKLNLLSLKALAEPQAQTSTSNQKSGKTPLGSSQRIQIDQLILSIGAATFTDLTGSVPVQHSFNLRMNHEVYRNVNGPADVVKIIVWEVLRRIGIGGLENVMGQIRGDLSGSLGTENLLAKAVSAIREKF